MIIENKFFQSLIKYRITITCIFFVALLFVIFWTALIFGFTAEQFDVSKTIIDYIPTIFSILALLLLVFYIITGILKSRIKRSESNMDNDESAVLISFEDAMVFRSRKIKIFMACWGSFVGVLIIAVTIFVLLGLEYYLESFSYLILFGVPIWFLLTWNFFSRKLN
jgi:hypothetical protein